MENVAWYQMLNRFSFFNTYFAFLDTENYLADGLFIKHQVRVYFGDEFVKPDFPYRIIFCHVRKWDKERFHAAMSELPNKMLLCGNVDYLDACTHVREWILNMVDTSILLCCSFERIRRIAPQCGMGMKRRWNLSRKEKLPSRGVFLYS